MKYILFTDTSGSYDSMKSAQATAVDLPVIIAISVTALLITLIVVDFACCRINQRGMTNIKTELKN